MSLCWRAVRASRRRNVGIHDLTPLVVALVLGVVQPGSAQAPSGEVTVSFHVTLAPSWFDPSTAPPQITPFGVLYAIHDALVRPLPGQKMGPSLAESWTESPDGLVYEFKLRCGLKFHNGDLVTADDAKWSFERYQGAGAKQLQARVRQVEAVDPLTVRFHNLNAAGIRMRMRPMERAAFYAAWQEKKLRGLFLVTVGNSGNAASRVEAFIYSKGSYASGGYPDLDELFLQQTRERDPAKREALLHRIQQAAVDRVMFAPLMDLRGLIAIGPRLADHTMNVIPMYPFPAYEDMRLKSP